MVYMMNEIEYGQLGSIPVDAWEQVGLSEDDAELFATDIGNAGILHSCPSCKGQENHKDALGLATSIIRNLQANDRRRFAEWRAKQTPLDRRKVRQRRMTVALQNAHLRREDAGSAARKN